MTTTTEIYNGLVSESFRGKLIKIIFENSIAHKDFSNPEEYRQYLQTSLDENLKFETNVSGFDFLDGKHIFKVSFEDEKQQVRLLDVCIFSNGVNV